VHIGNTKNQNKLGPCRMQLPNSVKHPSCSQVYFLLLVFELSFSIMIIPSFLQVIF